MFFLFDDPYVFPDPRLAPQKDIIAVGGDLSVERLVSAYSLGIFPWFNHEPILWWSPDPRSVLPLDSVHIPRSLAKLRKKKPFAVTCDTSFKQVIQNCALRNDGSGTWLVPEMIAAYCRLHECGVAHSIEVWSDTTLVGGMYGVALGRAFFGESMFYRQPNASKIGFLYLTEMLRDAGFLFVDCQQHTDNLQRFGAIEEPRDAFLDRLEEALKLPGYTGSWQCTLEHGS